MNRFEITASAPDKKAYSLLHYTKTDGIPEKQGITLWSCDECKHEVVSNHTVLASCPSCAGNMTAGKTAEMTAAELKAAHPVGECGFCNSVLVSASDATAEFKDKALHCPVCCETVTVADDAAAPDMSSDKDAGKKDDTDDLGDDNSDDTNTAELPDGEDESTDDSSDDTDDSSSDDDSSDDDDDDSDDEDDGDDDDSDDSDDEDDSETSDDDNSESGDNSDDSTSETDGKKKDDTAVTAKTDTLEASLLAAVAGKETEVDIVQSPDRSRWYMFADSTPVAISEAGRCDENIRGLFATNQFATAYIAASAEGVTQEIMDEFGFEPVKATVDVDEAVRQNVEAQVREKTEAHNMTATAYGDRFQQCFGMAAAGMPKRFFKDDRNPVEKALIAAFQRVGVRDADNIVSSAFREHGKTLYKTLVLRANDLMEKDDKTIEEIAKLIDDQEAPEERENNKPLPIAALASMEEEPVRAPKVILASDKDDDDVFANYFQRSR